MTNRSLIKITNRNRFKYNVVVEESPNPKFFGRKIKLKLKKRQTSTNWPKSNSPTIFIFSLWKFSFVFRIFSSLLLFVETIFLLQNASEKDNGIYKFIAKNDAGECQSLVNLTVRSEPSPPFVFIVERNRILFSLFGLTFFFYRKDQEQNKSTSNQLKVPVFTDKLKDAVSFSFDTDRNRKMLNSYRFFFAV